MNEKRVFDAATLSWPAALCRHSGPALSSAGRPGPCVVWQAAGMRTPQRRPTAAPAFRWSELRCYNRARGDGAGGTRSHAVTWRGATRTCGILYTGGSDGCGRVRLSGLHLPLRSSRDCRANLKGVTTKCDRFG
jgi:hypothetical protein